MIYDIVKTKETIKIKKDVCSVFTPMSGLNHVCCGSKVGGGSDKGVMGLHLVK